MIGILPVAGKATRIHGLPKFLLPVPGGYLLERMLSRMGVPCLIGTHPDNAALMSSYKRPEDTVYQVVTRDMPETLLAAREAAGTEPVLVGMPDTYWTDEQVFQRLADYLTHGAMCAAAVFHVSASMASHLGVCRLTSPGQRLAAVENKCPQTEPRWIWGALAWRPEFWQYLRPEDVHCGAALERALAHGVDIPLYFADGQYYDNGTPEGYFRCIRDLTGAAV